MRAQIRQLVYRAAVVAHKLAGMVMVGQRHIAILTLGYPRALFAPHHRSIAAPVAEQYRLVRGAHGIIDASDGIERKRAVHGPFLSRPFHIDDAYRRKGQLVVARGKAHKTEFAVESLIICVDSRSRAPEQRFGAVHRCEHQRHIAGIVAWSGLRLLVACLMLLVDNDEPQASERQKQRRTRAKYHARSRLGKHALPYVHPFVVGNLE